MKVALITGGSRGIGKCIAQRLHQVGYTTIINHFHTPREQITWLDEFPDIAAWRADVGDWHAVEGMFGFVREKFGRLDALVNNAGITRDRSFVKMSPDEWREVLDTNLGGVFNCARHAVALFKEQQSGSVINISSVVGETGAFGQVNYAASKAGIIGLTRALAIELARYNVTVNAVCPGYVNTEMVAAMPANVREGIVAAVPMHRLAEPAEIAAAVTYLVSDEARFVTGQCINVNGGLYRG